MKSTALIREIQLDLFKVEVARTELKKRLLKLGAGTKQCCRCKMEMDIEQFYRNEKGKDYRTSRCIECISELRKERYWRLEAA